MLKEIEIQQPIASDLPVGIIASKYNNLFVQGMLDGAKEVLLKSGMTEQKIVIVRVPGAYEIPLMAAKMAMCQSNRVAAIICLGVVIEGKTAHARLISEALTYELSRLQTTHGLPIVHEVLLLQDELQARQRCLDKRYNRGSEAAQTALEMVAVFKEFDARYS
ncbi:MAG: 6,7-dimethyl-8-ribityllumazine synthase [Verrucomicrobiota bacterium]|nr:6,7-dimethyl-8-ribityllumazine synthase [Verrucomicrobiota bacterium]